MRRATPLLPFVLCALLWGGSAAAQSASKLRDDPPSRVEPDGGREPKGTAALSPEDREVVENLELLENLEQSNELELLMELSKED